MGIIYSKCYNGVIMVPGFADGLERRLKRSAAARGPGQAAAARWPGPSSGGAGLDSDDPKVKRHLLDLTKSPGHAKFSRKSRLENLSMYVLGTVTPPVLCVTTAPRT